VGLPAAVHATRNQTHLRFLLPHGDPWDACPYRRMAAWVHYPEDWGYPRSGRERRGSPGLSLGPIRLRSNQHKLPSDREKSSVKKNTVLCSLHLQPYHRTSVGMT
jgi:hypothetical protein